MGTTTIKAYKGLGMEGGVARWYATNTRKNLNEFMALAAQVAGELGQGSRLLEVAPGPGYFAIELAKLGRYQVDGLDISKTFVEIAADNAREAGVDVAFRQGNASAMPFPDNTFDYVVCRAAFKNFTEPQKAVEEMYRVLRPGGRGLLIDLRRDASPEGIREEVSRMGLGAWNRFVTRLTFRFMLIKRAYTSAEFRQFFARPNFRNVDIQQGPIGLDIRFEK